MVKKFNFQETELSGAYLIDPFCATDERGGLIKDYNVDTFRSNGIDYPLKETFYTLSKKGTIRALHFQLGKTQPKLVRCISGAVYDVITDLRPWSPTYKKSLGFYLTGDNMKELLIPEYFGHGYLVLEKSVVSYKCAEGFYADGDSGIRYDDPDLAINWPFDEAGGAENLIISEKDKNLMSLREYEERLRKEGIAW